MRPDIGTPTEIVDRAAAAGLIDPEMREKAIAALEAQPAWCGCAPQVAFCPGDEGHEGHIRWVAHEARCKVSLVLRSEWN